MASIHTIKKIIAEELISKDFNLVIKSLTNFKFTLEDELKHGKSVGLQLRKRRVQELKETDQAISIMNKNK